MVAGYGVVMTKMAMAAAESAEQRCEKRKKTQPRKHKAAASWRRKSALAAKTGIISLAAASEKRRRIEAGVAASAKQSASNRKYRENENAIKPRNSVSSNGVMKKAYRK